MIERADWERLEEVWWRGAIRQSPHEIDNALFVLVSRVAGALTVWV